MLLIFHQLVYRLLWNIFNREGFLPVYMGVRQK